MELGIFMKLTDSTYRKLRDEIFDAKYKPNELITERQIAEKYGVSKLTAGEVLHRLCAEGHLTSYPRSGYMVTTLTPTERLQLSRIREALESIVLETLCQEASDDELRSLRRYIVMHPESDGNPTASNNRFHMAMTQMTNNRFLVSMLHDILGAQSRVEQVISADVLQSWQSHHEDMLNAGLMGSTLVYYFRYNVGNDNLMGLYSTALMVGMLVCIPLMGLIARKLGNVKSVLLGAALCFMAGIPRIITGDKSIVVFFICIVLMGFGSGLIANMMRQCRNDAATYSQLQGVDISGALCSLYSFSQKLGQAVSAIIAAGLLAAVDYTPGETPDAATLDLFFAENLLIPMATVVAVVAFLIPVIRMEKKLVKDIAEKENTTHESECI